MCIRGCPQVGTERTTGGTGDRQTTADHGDRGAAGDTYAGQWFVNGSKVFVRPPVGRRCQFWLTVTRCSPRASAPADLRYLLDRLRAVELERDDALRRFALHRPVQRPGRWAEERIAALEAECKLHWEDRPAERRYATHRKACTEVYAKYGRHAPYCLLTR